MANIAMGLIKKGYNRVDFINSALFAPSNFDILRVLNSNGCKAQLYSADASASLVTYDACSLPTDSASILNGELVDLAHLMLNQKYCVDVKCVDGLTDYEALNRIIEEEMAIVRNDLSRKRYWGVTGVSSSPFDGYMTQIMAPTSGVVTIPGATNAAITNPATVVAELNKVITAVLSTNATIINHPDFKILLSPLVWNALQQAQAMNINSVILTPTKENTQEFYFLGMYKMRMVSELFDTTNTGVALAGIFGNSREANFIWFDNAYEANDMNVTKSAEYRNTYYGYLDVYAQPFLANATNLVAYFE